MPAWTPKPRLEKLPLATRKEIRDSFEAKKGEYESTIAGLVGGPFKIDIDVNAVCAYVDLTSTGVGSILCSYVDGFISSLQHLIANYGDIGLEYFKKAVTKSTLTITVNELSEKASSIDADVKDGVFRILFRDTSGFGYNTGYLQDPFVNALENAPHEGFSFLAQYSIKSDYIDEIKDVRDEIATILNMPDLALDPNFEENFAALQKKTDDDWKRTFGSATFQYFSNGVRSQLVSQGFKDDDMMQEGFAEGVPSKTIKLRIVDKTNNGYSNEAVLEDGILYIQTTADRWWSNVYEAGSGIIDLL